MPIWNTYIDDSHSGGRVIDKKFQIIPTSSNGFTPWSGTGSVTILASKEKKILSEIDLLRKKIKRELTLEDLPILHMRQIWGKNPPKDKGRNPFIIASYDQRFQWVREFAELIADLSSSKIIYPHGTGVYIELIQEEYLKHFFGVRGKIEFSILERRFPKDIHKFYDILFNPLSALIIKNIAAVNNFCLKRGDMFNAVYDSTHGSKGIHTNTALDFCREKRHLDRLISIQEGNTRQQPMLQIADFVSYLLQRFRMERHKREEDVGVRKLLYGVNFEFLNIDESFRYDRAVHSTLAIFAIEFAFDYLRSIDRVWVDENMASMEKIYKNGAESDGSIHILKDEAIIGFQTF